MGGNYLVLFYIGGYNSLFFCLIVYCFYGYFYVDLIVRCWLDCIFNDFFFFDMGIFCKSGYLFWIRFFFY